MKSFLIGIASLAGILVFITGIHFAFFSYYLDTTNPEEIRAYFTKAYSTIIEPPTKVLDEMCAKRSFAFAVGWDRGPSGHNWPRPICGPSPDHFTDEAALAVCKQIHRPLLFNWQWNRLIVCGVREG